MPDFDKIYNPKPFTDDKGKPTTQPARQMYPTPTPQRKTKQDFGALSGRVPMPIGKHKGENIKDVASKDLPEFMKILGNLNKVAAMEKPPPNYASMQAAHEKMVEFAQENDLENQLKTWKAPEVAPKMDIENQLGDEGFAVPDGFAVDLVGPAERDDIRKIGTNRMNVLLSKLTPTDIERYPDFIELIKTYVSQAGDTDVGMETGSEDVVPTGIFMGEPSKFVRKFAGQPIDSLDDAQQAKVHMYFNYNLYKEQPNKFQAHKAFYDKLTQSLLEKGTIREMDGQFLYPHDILFYEKYKDSQPVGSIGDEAFPIDVSIIQKPNTRYVKRDKAGTPYYSWLFTELGTNNVLEYRDYTPPKAKSKDHEGLTFDYEMMGLRRADGASIEAAIKYHNMYKGVMRTRITTPVFIDKIKGGAKPAEKPVDPAVAAADAAKQDDSIRRDKELDQMLPKDAKNRISKSVQKDFSDKEQTDKLGNLVDKYKGESVKKESPSLNEHVERMLKVSNYKVIK